MMKKILLLTGIFMLFLTGFALAEDNDSMTVKTNVLKTRVEISVPSEIIFEDIAKGYLSERKDIEVENSGTVDVSITPELEDSSEEIFSKLSFQRVLSDPMTFIRYFSFDVEKPETVGGTNTENIYMYLDLSDYDEEIEEDLMDHEAEVIFWATPK